jgi:hypothetical protein
MNIPQVRSPETIDQDFQAFRRILEAERERHLQYQRKRIEIFINDAMAAGRDNVHFYDTELLREVNAELLAKGYKVERTNEWLACNPPKYEWIISWN